MRPASRTGLLLAAVLVQCYAARGGQTGCVPMEVYPTLDACRVLARQYQRDDNRALRVTGLPAVVSYRCRTIS
jgi:hypothetical protein